MSIRVLGEKYYNVLEVCTMIPVKKNSVNKYLRVGRLLGVKLAGQWYVSEGNLKSFLAGKKQVAEKLDEKKKEIQVR